MRMERKLGAVIVVLSVVCFAGCARVRNSIHSTVSDATDIVRADLGFSFGTDMGAHAMATQYVQLKSYSYEDLYRVGFGTRHIGVWKEEREDWWVGPWHARNMHVKTQSVKLKTGALAPKLRSGKDVALHFVMESPDEFGMGFHLFVVGGRIGVRPLEFVDLFTNLIGVDLCKDNMSWAERQRMSAMREAASKKAKDAKSDDDEPSSE